MPLHYILDGYNLIKSSAFNKIKKLRNQRFALIDALSKRKVLGSKPKITVVFDGNKEFKNFPLEKNADKNIEIIFTKDESADDWIKSVVNKKKPLSEVIVVSDDKGIISFVKGCGAKYLSTEEFLKKFFSPAKVTKEDLIKTELPYSLIQDINDELKKIWLK